MSAESTPPHCHDMPSRSTHRDAQPRIDVGARNDPLQTLADLNGLRSRLALETGLPEIGLGAVIIGAGVLSRLVSIAGELLTRPDAEIAILADRRPMTGANDTELKQWAAEQLAACGSLRSILIGDADHEVRADAEALATATRGVRGVELLVTIGSGTITDIGKYVSAQLGNLPHIVIQTAASVNGFADDQSVLLVDGVKRTTATRWPDRLIIDSEVISRAPAEMNRAGLGDLLASYTAPADWRLAGLMGQDRSFSQPLVGLTRDTVDRVLEHAPGIGIGDHYSLEVLAAGLTLSGIAMGAAGRTAPGSGMEHTVSHLLDMSGVGSHALHGAQVGVLSVFAACLWEVVRQAAADGALRQLRFPADDEMRARVFAAFADADPTGTMAAECWSDYSRKLARHRANARELADLTDRWSAFDTDVGRLLAPPERLADALREAGAVTHMHQLGIEADRVRWALTNCHLMRDRFTIADLAFLLGLWDDAGVEHVVRTAQQFGCGL